ncbi:hypothetical protein OPT61_g2607 [Boeremia exigua]|uniref:Uncharacterized protein n=1 Tax=Boeremia exigua TaxID=749465 RepID=A0ACC2IL55_9PLEO|nr:hypothetical protein OPT61_g2607 [Boeremia exigua]
MPRLIGPRAARVCSAMGSEVQGSAAARRPGHGGKKLLEDNVLRPAYSGAPSINGTLSWSHHVWVMFEGRSEVQRPLHTPVRPGPGPGSPCGLKGARDPCLSRDHCPLASLPQPSRIVQLTADLVLDLLSKHYAHLDQCDTRPVDRCLYHQQLTCHYSAVEFAEKVLYPCLEAFDPKTVDEDAFEARLPYRLDESATQPMEMLSAAYIIVGYETNTNYHHMRTLEVRLHLDNVHIDADSSLIHLAHLLEQTAWVAIDYYPSDPSILLTLVIHPSDSGVYNVWEESLTRWLRTSQINILCGNPGELQHGYSFLDVRMGSSVVMCSTVIKCLAQLRDSLERSLRITTSSHVPGGIAGKHGNVFGAAVFEGQMAVLLLLLDRGANTDTGYGGLDITLRNNGVPGLLDPLLDSAPDINKQIEGCEPAIGAALLHNMERAVELSLGGETDVKMECGDFDNISGSAAYARNKKAVELLLAKGWSKYPRVRRCVWKRFYAHHQKLAISSSPEVHSAQHLPADLSPFESHIALSPRPPESEIDAAPEVHNDEAELQMQQEMGFVPESSPPLRTMSEEEDKGDEEELVPAKKKRKHGIKKNKTKKIAAWEARREEMRDQRRSKAKACIFPLPSSSPQENCLRD